MNGPASTPTGQGSVTAAQMAVDNFGGTVLGKPISVIVGDHQLKPDIGAEKRGILRFNSIMLFSFVRISKTYGL